MQGIVFIKMNIYLGNFGFQYINLLITQYNGVFDLFKHEIHLIIPTLYVTY